MSTPIQMRCEGCHCAWVLDGGHWRVANSRQVSGPCCDAMLTGAEMQTPPPAPDPPPCQHCALPSFPDAWAAVCPVHGKMTEEERQAAYEKHGRGWNAYPPPAPPVNPACPNCGGTGRARCAIHGDEPCVGCSPVDLAALQMPIPPVDNCGCHWLRARDEGRRQAFTECAEEAERLLNEVGPDAPAVVLEQLAQWARERAGRV